MCRDCNVRMLVGDKLAHCENCGRFKDLSNGRKGMATYHPLKLVVILAAFLTLLIIGVSWW